MTASPSSPTGWPLHPAADRRVLPRRDCCSRRARPPRHPEMPDVLRLPRSTAWGRRSPTSWGWTPSTRCAWRGRAGALRGCSPGFQSTRRTTGSWPTSKRRVPTSWTSTSTRDGRSRGHVRRGSAPEDMECYVARYYTCREQLVPRAWPVGRVTHARSCHRDRGQRRAPPEQGRHARARRAPRRLRHLPHRDPRGPRRGVPGTHPHPGRRHVLRVGGGRAGPRTTAWAGTLHLPHGARPSARRTSRRWPATDEGT